MRRENDPFEFPVYENISQKVAVITAAKLCKTINTAPKSLFPENLQCNAVVMCEIINKIQMRKVYFRVFHDCIMGEINEVALYCFWIVKFVPFYAEKQNTLELNVKIAVYLLLRTLTYHVNNKKCGTLRIDEKTLNEIYYALKNRDLSKEAIMILASALVR
ncbi:MAG: hypothetical protein FWE23_05320 [Chitinivibrionia bacterium]|nr:hypothetical protein [Chitinivibrionia bacterium]